jgi:hypothetical protein
MRGSQASVFGIVMERKAFFFEKKKQKTFEYSSRAVASGVQDVLA